MERRPQQRVDAVREGPLLPQARHAAVQALDLRRASAEHDHVRVEHVEHGRERARHPVLVAPERHGGGGLAAGRARHDLGWLEGFNEWLATWLTTNKEIYDFSFPKSGGKPNPVEHFLFDSKRGHCEFFSTTMALMLREIGIPSRNVTGFVGGTYNRFGRYYAVREGDAHSWVEAYLDDPIRGWVTFDPTPTAGA